MTIWQATEELKQVFDKWFNFEYWAYLQLEIRGEYSQERMSEVCENHKRAEMQLNEFQTMVSDNMQKMLDLDESKEAVNNYSLSVQKERDKLVNAWRSLEGTPE